MSSPLDIALVDINIFMIEMSSVLNQGITNKDFWSYVLLEMQL